MITKFSVLYVGQIELDKVGLHGTPAAEEGQLLYWRPRPHAQRTESTPRVRPSGAASHLDPFEGPASTFSINLALRTPPGGIPHPVVIPS